MDNIREKLVELLREVQYLGGLEEKIADHMIANGVTVQEWIPVTERLPEDRREVLAVLWEEEVDLVWYDKGEGCWKSEFVNAYEDGEVTYWMPLPQPPKA